MTRRNFNQWIVMMLVCVLGIGTATAHGETLESLKESFAKRLPQLAAAKQAGKVGETTAGKVEAVKGDGDVAQLVTDENADRTSLYALIAKKENTTAEAVSQRAARRNFEKAAAGEWLKGNDGVWKQKK